MRQKKSMDARRKTMSLNLKNLSAAVASVLLLSSAHAAGLGKLTVLSALGQPLHAEIELSSVSKEETGSVAVKLASPEAFRQANIEFNPVLFSLRFSIEQRGGQQFVRVTSSQPINEPFVDMLLEIGGTNSRLTREYTFLLDPPDLRKPQSAQVAAIANSSSQAAPPRISQPSAPAPASEPAASVARSPSAAGNARAVKVLPQSAKQSGAVRAEENKDVNQSAKRNEYLVKQGDTLVKIAAQIKPEGISLDQILVALQRANPDAFVGNNIHRLKSGHILSVPEQEALRGISDAEAKNIVMAQTADFNSYRNKLAIQVANASLQKGEESRQSATGKITAKVEEQSNPANEAKDKLRLSKSGTAAPSGANAAGASVEEKIAREKALAEANARVQELEKNVADLQKLLEIKNKELAERQKQASENKVAAAPVATVDAAKSAPVSGSVSPAPSASTANATPPAASPAAPEAQAAKASPASGAAASTPTAAGSSATPSNQTAAAKTDKTSPANNKPAVQAPPSPEPGFLDNLLDNPILLGIGGAAVAGLAGLGLYTRRRRKQLSEFQDSSLLADSGLKTNSLFGSTGGQSVDTNNSVFNSSFTPSASQLDTNEVDPVAEADVYIAYGRDAQAEEILKEALRTQPERNAVRLKLLEIYAGRKDLRAFETIASELYGNTKGEGEDWQQAASLGMSIDPKNPLYAGGKPAANSVQAKANAAAASKAAVDELDLDALLNTTQGANSSLIDSNADDVDSGLEMKTHAGGSEDNAALQPASEPEHKFGHTASEAALTAAPMEIPKISSADQQRSEIASDASSSSKQAAEVAPLDFDFDMPGLGIKEETPAAPVANERAPQLNGASSELDFELELDRIANEVSHIQFDTLATDEMPDESIAQTKRAAEHNDSLQFHMPEVGDAPFAASQAAAAAPMELDLSGITLDLASPNIEQELEPSAGVTVADLSGGMGSNVTEMATKLDLALAYQEIGDKDGAKELLEEVVAGGSSDQIEKAKSMLLKIA